MHSGVGKDWHSLRERGGDVVGIESLTMNKFLIGKGLRLIGNLCTGYDASATKVPDE
ncbi:hypothetical protein K443DRAFT_680432 [Laccaria amethystina LaAM-08-1]|uniref:Uncharacterized protein n=1 Tax=Laccaria amethystina LaAM-08-1 TaxID=1095629 RepID=A0A0C9WN75_9AGAR|nr:hypothetical protein K443DRAFT_680432 [Laccaria amethystina LaAM-08-1]